MVKKICLLLLLSGSFNAFSQDSLREIGKNHYSFSIMNGVSISKSTIKQGAEKPENSASFLHGFNFQYTRNITDHWSVGGIAGFGFLPFTYKVAARDSFEGTEYHGYFGRTYYQIFSNLALQGAYRNQISEKYAFKLHGGFGIRNFANSMFTIGGGNQYATDYFFSGKFEGDAKPYASLGAGLIRTLRNKDEISIHLAYEQSFRDVYSGTYFLHGGSTGTFSNSGSNLNLALTYTFTGDSKNEKINTLMKTGSDKKAARKRYRKELRFIDPKSTFISLSAGTGLGINKVKDESNYFEKGAFEEFASRIAIEKGIAKNYFAEAGFNTLSYYAVMKFDKHAMGSSAFDAYQVSVGAGKRLITKNNYNVVNIHAGLSFGVTNLQKGYAGEGMTGMFTSVDSTGQPQGYTMQAFSKHYGTGTTITSAYIGLSKDFRLVRNLYLSLSYRYQQGFYAIYKQEVEYFTPSSPEIKHATISINGSSHTYQAGLKFKIDPKK